MSSSYMKLFIKCISREFNNLHSIQQRIVNCVLRICSGDEQDLTQVHRRSDVMIVESMILLRVEDFKHGGRWVTMVIVHPDLIDFIEKEDRVVHTHFPKALDDEAREGSNVGPSVATNFRLVAYSTQ